jgi:hypothetical protein
VNVETIARLDRDKIEWWEGSHLVKALEQQQSSQKIYELICCRHPSVKPCSNALTAAIKHHHPLEVFGMILNRDVHPNRSHLLLAINEKAPTEVIHFLIQSKAPLSEIILRKAIENSSSQEVIELLIFHGAPCSRLCLRIAKECKLPKETLQVIEEAFAKSREAKICP